MTNEQDPKDKRMEELLSGEVDTGNKYVEYFLGKMRECSAEKQDLLQKLQQHKQIVERLETALISVNTEHQKYGDDVAHFDPILQELLNPPKIVSVEETLEEQPGVSEEGR